MNRSNQNGHRQAPWLLVALAAAFAAAALRRWQLSSAFEEDTGLPIPWAPASVILACILVMTGAWLVIQAMHQPMAKGAGADGQGPRWDLVFLENGDLLYPIVMILAAFLALAAVPFLLKIGVDQWQVYQEALAARKQNPNVQLPSNNGALTIATAVGALVAFVGLLQMGRDGLRTGRRGKGGFSAVLPGIAGCVWLMECFRGHAANPVQWDYAPLLLAIVCGMLLYMDFAGISTGAGHPRRLLWVSAMTLVISAPALVSALAEWAMADVLLLLAQMLVAAAVLWRLAPSLEDPPQTKGTPIPRPGEVSIQEETTDE